MLIVHLGFAMARKSSDMPPLGRLIKSGLKRQARTQEWLGEALGVSKQSVSAWCAGRSLPEPQKFPVLAACLDVPIGAVALAVAGTDPGLELARSLDCLSPSEKRLIERYRRASPRIRELIESAVAVTEEPRGQTPRLERRPQPATGPPRDYIEHKGD